MSTPTIRSLTAEGIYGWIEFRRHFEYRRWTKRWGVWGRYIRIRVATLSHTCYVQRLENQYPEEKAAVSWVRRRNYAHFTRAGVLLKVNSKFRIFQEAETCGLVPRDQNLVVTGECTVNLRDESTLIPNCARSYKKRMKYWTTLYVGHPVAQLRNWTTSRKVAGSIPDDANGIIYWYNPSGRAVAWGWLSL